MATDHSQLSALCLLDLTAAFNNPISLLSGRWPIESNTQTHNHAHTQTHTQWNTYKQHRCKHQQKKKKTLSTTVYFCHVCTATVFWHRGQLYSVVDGVTSRMIHDVCYVAQGSVLGTLLFILYTSELTQYNTTHVCQWPSKPIVQGFHMTARFLHFFHRICIYSIDRILANALLPSFKFLICAISC